VGVDRAHKTRWAQMSPGTALKDAVSLGVMAVGYCRHRPACGVNSLIQNRFAGIYGSYPGLIEKLLGQIEAPPPSIFINVAYDIRQLKRTSQMMSKTNARLFLHLEDSHRKPSDRTRDAITIEVELGNCRCANVFDHIHLHPVDHREEVLLAQ